MRFNFGGRALWLLSVLLASLVLAGGIAYAAIPDATGVIHGCRNSGSGLLRVIDSGTASCKRREMAVNWNQVGPEGPAGPEGPQGIQGEAGPEGPPGAGVSQIDPIRVAGGQSEVLLTAGSFTLTAVCQIDFQPPAPVPTIDQATINVSTTQDNTAVAGVASAKEIDPGQTALLSVAGGSGAENALSFGTNSFYVLAPDGTKLSGQLAAGTNLTDQVDSCVFSGYVVTG